MGLDWDPLPRPKRGHEEEFAKLHAQLASGDDEALRARFFEISEPAYETLGAPQVGIDAEADDWLRTKVGDDKFNEARESMRGYYVLDLLPPCDGFPVYTHNGLLEGLDRYSFRAKFLDDVEDVLGDELNARAWNTMSAEELHSYGETLLQLARAFARKNNVEHVEQLRDVEFEDESPATRAHILFAAAKWCLYWSERGHGLSPWF